jgi:hypothetical protein
VCGLADGKPKRGVAVLWFDRLIEGFICSLTIWKK